MLAQQGYFSFAVPSGSDQRRALKALRAKGLGGPVGAPCLLKKAIVPAAQKPYFIRQLLAMNVTGYSLFPGLDDEVRAVRDEIQTVIAWVKEIGNVNDRALSR